MCRPRAAAATCLLESRILGPVAPLSELRRRCDTNTNFYCNQNQ